MQQCPKCGSENTDDTSFCSLCYMPFGGSVPSVGYGVEPSAGSGEERRGMQATVSAKAKTDAFVPAPEIKEGKVFGSIPGVIGIEGISEGRLRQELKQGGKFVVFQYCYSLLVVTFRRVSPLYFIRAGENGILHGMRYSLIALLLGWWGFPWGPVFTVGSLFNNFKGGINVTGEVVRGANIIIPQDLVSGADFHERKQYSRPVRIAAGVAIGLLWLIIFLIIGSIFFE